MSDFDEATYVAQYDTVLSSILSGVSQAIPPRTIYDGLQGDISVLTASVNFEPSMTKQSFTEECDIKYILDRFAQDGVFPSENRGVPKYGDFASYQQGDYLQAQLLVNEARDSFMELPADARKLFDNDPGVFLDFITDPANAEKAVALGLATSLGAPSERPQESGAEGAPNAPEGA